MSFLSVCEITDDENIEALREKTVSLLELSYAEPSEAINRELGYVWDKFRRQFSEYFEGRHTAVMRSGDLKRQLHEILKTDEWWEFEMLSDLQPFDQRFVTDAAQYRSRILALECGVDVKENLEYQPFCICGFTLAKGRNTGVLPDILKATVNEGLRTFRKSISANSGDLVSAIGSLAGESTDAELSKASKELMAALSGGSNLPAFSDIQLKVLRQALGETMPSTRCGKSSGSESKPHLAAPVDTSFEENLTDPSDDQVMTNI